KDRQEQSREIVSRHQGGVATTSNEIHGGVLHSKVNSNGILEQLMCYKARDLCFVVKQVYSYFVDEEAIVDLLSVPSCHIILIFIIICVPLDH
uniref:Uncharacterized protein n=1 Tax=Romanomermis culicivorax TaxID=13658 RepID=A0A915IFY4_ROMCU